VGRVAPVKSEKARLIKLDSRGEKSDHLPVRRLKLLSAVVGLGLAVSAFRLPLGAVVAAPEGTTAGLSIGDALVLGLVEGITEYLPISSTGHLIIANHALRLDSETPLSDAAGRPLWFREASARHPDGERMTLKRAADTFSIIIQFGAILAVGVLYWPQLLGIVFGLLGRDPAGLRLLRNLLIAFAPAAVVGLSLDRWIDRHLFSVQAVITAQISGAVLMLAAERWRRKYATSVKAVLSVSELPARGALGIGFMQCLALWPGMSRSMTTIVGGYFAGFEPVRAAEFSFLLGFVTLGAATAYKGYESGAAMLAVFGWPHVLLGLAIAAISAAGAVRFLVGFLTRHGLAAFAWYRFALAGVLCALYFA